MTKNSQSTRMAEEIAHIVIVFVQLKILTKIGH